ncbi:MAG: ParB N-terminal domain-containing protein [Treponema sp.]|nr:ParB N-terminal domain-containing protein [Spirochaetia bacterium]MDD7699665.1 ParB N-terminal domain-containing protein [Spirochaetia bacterium]
MLVNISEIKIKRRVRKDLGDLEPLKDSLRRYGLLNPVTIDSQYNLIAGERRLAAAKAIGWTSINAVIINNVSPLTKLELELEENNQRKEFTDAELLEGYKRLEKLRNPNFFRRLLNALISLFKWIAKSVKKLFKK